MKLLDSSLARFVLVGISNTMVGFAVIAICFKVLGLSDVVSNALGYLVGFLWSFVFNRAWTFNHSRGAGGALLRYTLVCGCGYLVNLFVLTTVRRWIPQAHLMAQIPAAVSYSGVVYLGSRFFAFASSPASKGF